MKPNRKLMWALGLTVVATGWMALRDDTAEDPAALVPAGRQAATTVSPRPASPSLPVSATAAAAFSGPWSTPLRPAWTPAAEAARSAWTPPEAAAMGEAAAAAAATAAPQEPQVPAVPYTLIGRFEQEGKVMALIAGPNRTFSSKAGDVLDGQWRVDSIQPTSVTLTWLPADARRTLAYRPS